MKNVKNITTFDGLKEHESEFENAKPSHYEVNTLGEKLERSASFGNLVVVINESKSPTSGYNMTLVSKANASFSSYVNNRHILCLSHSKLESKTKQLKENNKKSEAVKVFEKKFSKRFKRSMGYFNKVNKLYA